MHPVIMNRKFERRKTRRIMVGDVPVGGQAPVSVQSMVKVRTAAVKAVIARIRRLEETGCDIVRVAVKDRDDADAIRTIVSKVRIPVVADIHFDHRLALRSIEAGADKIRINPGNMTDPGEIRSVIKAAKRRRIPIRIGLNSGSFPATDGGSKEDSMVRSAMRAVRMFEQADFNNIIISLKASDVVSTISAYKKLSRLCDYPLHLGVTASGLPYEGAIKSAIGIGTLLFEGIGDTIRVSLTGSPEEEVWVAQRILSALNIRSFGPEIISCPTCGRCGVDLVRVVREFEKNLKRTMKSSDSQNRPVTIAIMGCEVNGPGEAKEADIGIAAGKGSGVLFRRGKVLRRIAEKDFVKELLKELRRLT